MALRPSDLGSTTAIAKPIEEIFDYLIRRHWKGSGASFTVDQVRTLLKDAEEIAALNLSRRNNWQDVIEFYRDLGWQVTFTRPPGRDEGYPAYFQFIKG